MKAKWWRRVCTSTDNPYRRRASAARWCRGRCSGRQAARGTRGREPQNNTLAHVRGRCVSHRTGRDRHELDHDVIMTVLSRWALTFMLYATSGRIQITISTRHRPTGGPTPWPLAPCAVSLVCRELHSQSGGRLASRHKAQKRLHAPFMAESTEAFSDGCTVYSCYSGCTT